MSNMIREKVLKESKDLDLKVQRLKDFINSSQFHLVDDRNKTLLKIQLSTMKTYSLILEERVRIL